MIRNALLLTIPTLILCLIALEVITTFVIPGAQFPYYYYDEENRVLRFSTTDLREGVFTIGPMAQQRARWHINNAGWNSDVEFEEAKRRPRIAIIGDSYVEALQVNIEESLAGRLRALVSNEVDVYAFGISGAALSQYLQMSRYVRARFDPDILVVNVVHNDFDESLCSVKRQAGMLCLEEVQDALVEGRMEPYRAAEAFRAARLSSTVRYAVANLKVVARIRNLFTSNASTPSYNANIDVEQVAAQKAKIGRATAYVLETLVQEYRGKSVIVMMDAPRHDIYADTLERSTVRWLNELLRNSCESVGIPFIDLTEGFLRQYRAEHVHFETEWDWHWNQNGHLTAARQLRKRLAELRLI